MIDIVFASNNKGKWKELVDDFAINGINLILSKEYLDLIEDEETLVSNSYSKAKSAAKKTGKMAIGDDSGIYTTALFWFPGVHSRRWYGTPADDDGRNKRLLEIMKDEEDREVFLISHFTLVNPEGEKLFTTHVKNRFLMSDKISGKNGFGYDPILIPDPKLVYWANEQEKISDERTYEIINNKLTVAELTQDEKNAINDRGQIAWKVKKFIMENNI